MQDSIIKGNGNSRKLKSVANFLSVYPTYADFAAALVAGTLPVDFNGINDAGFDVVGTPLNKASLLTDETAAKLGTFINPTPNDILSVLGDAIGGMALSHGSYPGTQTENVAATTTVDVGNVNPALFLVFGTDGSYSICNIAEGKLRQNMLTTVYNTITFDSDTHSVSWIYATGSGQKPSIQFNESGCNYTWVAIGTRV